MEVLILLIFVSLMLVVLATMFFIWNVRTRSHEHVDRTALLPLTSDDPVEHEQR